MKSNAARRGISNNNNNNQRVVVGVDDDGYRLSCGGGGSTQQQVRVFASDDQLVFAKVDAFVRSLRHYCVSSRMRCLRCNATLACSKAAAQHTRDYGPAHETFEQILRLG
eukprot:GHVS01088634.1.p1 GENE.GHVS01088634.1~~GHVS01088634.1.p1  ORF type:complete len:110 (-),score=27.03 GHVS01088634.1:79-408(-)